MLISWPTGCFWGCGEAVFAGQAGGGTSPWVGDGEAGGHRPPTPRSVVGGLGCQAGLGAPLGPRFGENQPGLGLSQLEEAARRWGREKQELGTRLLEREHSFPHAPTSVSTRRGPGPPCIGGWRPAFAAGGVEGGSGSWGGWGSRGLHAQPPGRIYLSWPAGPWAGGRWKSGP